MAKLTAPLFSFGASGKIADSLVYFPWKGLDAVRQYVIPANPRSADQVTQRGHLTDAVATIHDAMALATDPLNTDDKTAYALLASVHKAAQTWFNEAVRQFVNQRVAGRYGCIYRDGTVTPGSGQLQLVLKWTKDATSSNTITAGKGYIGTSKSAMLTSVDAVIASGEITCTFTNLTAGQKYYMTFKSTAHDDFDGTQSGIYTGTPS